MAVALLAATTAAGYPWALCDDATSKFEPNSAYQANLKRVAGTLPKNASTSAELYATTVVGAIPAQLGAIALCRADINAFACNTCLTKAFADLLDECSYNKKATIYYDYCMVHYSDVHTLGDTGPSMDMYQVTNNNDVKSDPARFKSLLAALINATAEYAANNSTRRFATGEADFNQEFPKVYSVAQCTPDQTPVQCRRCLAIIIGISLRSFQSKIGGRVLGVDCTYRYETTLFYNGPAMVRLAPSRSRAPPPAPGAAGGGGGNHRVPWVVLAVVLPTLAALNLLAFLCFQRQRRSNAQDKQRNPNHSTEVELIKIGDFMMMKLSVLRAATRDFNGSNKLGEGSFGPVYKGVLRDGTEIAVKRLSTSSMQGVAHLKNELKILAKLEHNNLVRILGACLDHQESLLVYEFMPNRSLDLVLFDTKNELLDWEQRYKIINGIAQGLQYLHEDSQHKVVHRDLKASNILLDENMNPKISDFGLARIMDQEKSQAMTSKLAGTIGYMAPEYHARRNYSIKSDAFSFGVIVLEIVTGRKNDDYNLLLTTVWEHWEARTVVELVDPRIGGSFPERDVLRYIDIGLLCVQADPAARPVMSAVVKMLGGDTVLEAPSKPWFFARSNRANTAASPAS